MSYEPYHKTTIDCKNIRPHTKELVDRCGTAAAAAEYAFVSPQTIQRVLHGVHCTVQKATARKILIALEHRREEDRRNHEVHERLRKERQRQAQQENRIFRDGGLV